MFWVLLFRGSCIFHRSWRIIVLNINCKRFNNTDTGYVIIDELVRYIICLRMHHYFKEVNSLDKYVYEILKQMK